MRNESAVTIAIKKIEKGTSVSRSIKTIDANFEVQIASSLSNKEKAFRLAYDTYEAKGFLVAPRRDKMLVSESDLLPDTTIFTITEKDSKEVIATLTLNFQAHAEVPSYEIFPDEISSLQAQKKSFAEITRLAIKEGHRYSNLLLVRLFNAAHLYSLKVKKIENILISVNPSHVGFYQKLLGFEIIGDEKPCGRVNGAPARLLLLDLNKIEFNLNRFYQNKLNTTSQFKFYKFAVPLSESILWVQKFKKQQRPMSFLEKTYFGLFHKAMQRV